MDEVFKNKLVLTIKDYIYLIDVMSLPISSRKLIELLDEFENNLESGDNNSDLDELYVKFKDDFERYLIINDEKPVPQNVLKLLFHFTNKK